MRLVCLILALLVATALAAQERKPPAKKQIAHKKPTAEQIRKFNALHKKQQELKR